MGSTIARPKSRSLFPKEHGAYGQLAMPLLAALACARPTGAATLFAIACVALFLGHEPVLILLGRRGGRAKREDGPRAQLRLVALSLVAVSAGGAGIALAPSAARALILPLILGLAVAVVIARDAEKTLLGEIVAAAALAATAVPVALASGQSLRWALAAWGAWSLGFAAATAAVRAVIAHRKRPTKGLHRVGLPLVLAAVTALLSLTHTLPPLTAVAASPLLALAIGLAAIAPDPKQLANVGWVLVVGSATTLSLLVASAHTGIGAL